MDEQRYARSLILPGFGPAAQRRLATARVLIIGAGGLGSTVIPALAAAGVGADEAGALGILDDDVVEASNLPRQTIHSPADVGRSKARSAADRVATLNPDVSVEVHEVRLETSNVLEIFEDYDLVVDGSDGLETRYLANDAAVLLGMPLVWGSVSQYAGIVGVAWAQRGPHYRDLYPDAPDDVVTCEAGGVLPTLVATIGSMMATEAIKILTGVGDPLLGRALVVDARSGTVRELGYERAPFRGHDPMDPSTQDPPAAQAGADSPFPRSGDARAPGPAAGITNGGSPRMNESITPQELDGLRPSVQLVDVREEWEAQIVALEGSVLVPLGTLAAAQLDPAVPVVVYCHHGVRSEHARRILADRGFIVGHLAGGIDAYAREVDPTLPTY